MAKLNDLPIANLQFYAECPGLCLGKLLGIVSTHATGVAVQIVGPPGDSAPDEGPEARPK